DARRRHTAAADRGLHRQRRRHRESMMASDSHIDGYARALFEVARAEGTLDEVEDELFRFGRALEASDELRSALGDEQIPVAKRQAIIEDLLGRPESGSAATATTVQLVSLVVAGGRAGDLPAIIDRLVQRAAQS